MADVVDIGIFFGSQVVFYIGGLLFCQRVLFKNIELHHTIVRILFGVSANCNSRYTDPRERSCLIIFFSDFCCHTLDR